MNVRLLRLHYVNGQVFSPGTVLNLPEDSARNLVANGGGEWVDDEGRTVPPAKTDRGPIPVPHTKDP